MPFCLFFEENFIVVCRVEFFCGVVEIKTNTASLAFGFQLLPDIRLFDLLFSVLDAFVITVVFLIILST